MFRGFARSEVAANAWIASQPRKARMMRCSNLTRLDHDQGSGSGACAIHHRCPDRGDQHRHVVALPQVDADRIAIVTAAPRPPRYRCERPAGRAVLEFRFLRLSDMPWRSPGENYQPTPIPSASPDFLDSLERLQCLTSQANARVLCGFSHWLHSDMPLRRFRRNEAPAPT